MSKARVAGLLINYDQAKELASHINHEEVTQSVVASGVCILEGARWGIEVCPLDVNGVPTLLLGLFVGGRKHKFDLEKLNGMRRVESTREWLEQRGVTGAKEMKLVSKLVNVVPDPFD